jgi:CDP-diacylglycerol--glycerol-3-phosphate 3-phosphatidyltransferase
MTTANKITIFRIILVPIMLILISIDGLHNIQTIFSLDLAELLFAILFVVGSLSDFLDGYIARHFNQISTFGKFLDPIADKILVFLGFLFLLSIDKIELWIVVIILLREFLISGVRLVSANKNIVIAASIWGKLKTIFTMVGLVFILFTFKLGDPFKIIGDVLIYLATAFTVLSGLDYIIKAKDTFKEDTK